MERGATDAECTLAEGEEFSAQVRMRALETLKDAGSRRVGLRVLVGKRVGSAHTSDLSDAGMRQMVESALAVAAISTEDPLRGLAGRLRARRRSPAICNSIRTTSYSIDTPARIQAALETEEAALSWDPRITNSEGASFGAYTGERVFANSRGFLGSYRTSSCSIEHHAGGAARRRHGARLLVFVRA